MTIDQNQNKTSQSSQACQQEQVVKTAIGAAVETREGRRAMAKTFHGFCFAYLPHYLGLEPGEFHPELMWELQNDDEAYLAITGFRGSAKSTLASLALPLWRALEEKSKFILLFGDTDSQTKLNLENIKYELETNELLINDYGDQSEGIEKSKSWTQRNLLLKSGTRILGRSRGQKVRGLRHRQYRPDLVIIDDPEELEKVQKKEYRDKTERWLTGDVIPAIEEFKSRLIIIGNMLHTDSLQARLKCGKIGGGLFKYLEYPLVDKDGKVAWQAKYPTKEHLERQEKKVGRTAWLREYLLKVVPPEGQEVKDEWIQYYDQIPVDVMRAGVGVDLAISKKETADFTAMVSGIAALDDSGRPRIYVLPNPVNERLSSLETQNQMRSVSQALKFYTMATFFMEEVAYQKAAIELAQAQLLAVVGIRPGADKRARLRTAATFIQNGTVLFPKTGCEDLLAQVLGFGIEEHDDLCDALVYLIFGLSEEGMELPDVIALG